MYMYTHIYILGQTLYATYYQSSIMPPGQLQELRDGERRLHVRGECPLCIFLK